MSFSAVVDQRYRLVPADLGGRPRVVMITRVSYQGVETLQPLLHFENMAKPLALTAEQRYAVSQIARSNVIADWAGVMLELVPAVDEAGRAIIDIYPIGERRSNRAVRASASSSERSTYVRPQYERPQYERPAYQSPQYEAPQPVALPVARAEPQVNPITLPTPAPSAEPDASVAFLADAPSTQANGWLAGEVPEVPVWLPILLALLLILALAAVFWLEFM